MEEGLKDGNIIELNGSKDNLMEEGFIDGNIVEIDGVKEDFMKDKVMEV